MKTQDDTLKHYFCHSAAIVELNNIGDRTRIWAFAHILPGAIIGEDCNICDHVFIENDVVVGNRVTVKCGVQLWDGVRLEDDVFIGPNATFTNDPFPRSKHYPEKYVTTTVRQSASVGANATILPGLTVGRGAMVGAGAVVTHDVPPHAVVVGNPARIIGYQGSYQNKTRVKENISEITTQNNLLINGVRIVDLPLIKDLRGNLSVAEFKKDLPFEPCRVFWVFDVPSKDVRGEHAHRTLHQFIICLKGSCSIVLDDGKNRAEVSLNTPSRGIYIPPMIWGIQYKFSSDAVMIVFASEAYDASEYIRDYDEFLKLVDKP